MAGAAQRSRRGKAPATFDTAPPQPPAPTSRCPQDDLLPRTTDNFLRLCEAPEGQGYKGSVIHKVRRQMGVEFGDFVRGDGSGGRSALDSSGVFEDEGFVGRHTVPGTLTMCNHGRDTNNSVVFMSNAPMPHLDGTHVLFGRVTSGLEAVEDMSKTFCMNLRPVDAITIVECGEIRG